MADRCTFDLPNVNYIKKFDSKIEFPGYQLFTVQILGFQTSKDPRFSKASSENRQIY